MAFKIKDGIRIGTVDVFNSSGELLVNAPTASALETGRTIALSGDASGSAVFDGANNVTIDVTISGFDSSGGTPTLSGDIIGDVYASDGTTKILENGSNGSDSWVRADVRATNGTTTVLDAGTNGTDATFQGDLLATDGLTTVLTVGDGATTPQFEGNANSADTADKWDTARTVTFATGDVTGSFSIDGSANVGNVDLTIGAGVVENTMLVNDHFTLATNGTGANFDIQLGDTWNFNEGTGISVEIGTDTVTISGVNATDTGTKGVATFASADFNVTSGTVELEDTVIKGLTVDASAPVTPSAHSIQITGGEGIDVTAAGAVITVAGEDATTTNKGIASFSSDNFTVTSGAVSIKDGGISNAELANDSVTIGTTEVVLGATSTTLAGLTQVDIDNIRIADNTISSTDTDGDIVLDPNGTGTVDVSNARITSVATPTADTDAANKAYVDAVAEGLSIKPAVRAATTANLTATYDNGTNGVGATLTSTSNGAFPTIDGVSSWSQFDGILVKDQTNEEENGRYYVATVGDAGTPWVLTRCAKCDENTEIPSMFVFVQEGTLYNSTGWVATVDTLPMTVGTDEIIFVQFSGAGTYTAGDGLSLTGTEFDVNVDDATIEINADTLRVKDSGITNAKLANDSLTVAADSGTPDAVALGETLTITGGTGISTSVSANEITITNDDVGSSQDIVKSVIVSDTPGGGTYSDTGTYTVSGNSDSLTFESSTGIDIDIDTTNGVLRFENTQRAFKTISVSGQNDVVADSIDDTLTIVAGTNITVTTNETADSITINATSSTEGDDAFDNITDTVATTAATVIDSFALATYRSAKYYIQISQGTDYQISELMVIHDGTTTYDTEFAVLETTGELGTLTTSINGANVELSVTMASATSASIIIKRLLIEV